LFVNRIAQTVTVWVDFHEFGEQVDYGRGDSGLDTGSDLKDILYILSHL